MSVIVWTDFGIRC